jgi:hypothetical protein
VVGIQELDIRTEALTSRIEWDEAHVVNPLIRGSYRKIDLDLIKKKQILNNAVRLGWKLIYEHIHINL